MGDPYGAFGLIDMLAPGPAAAVGVDLQVLGVDLHLHVLGLGQHRHRGRAGVDAALGLGFRYPLHPVHPALVFHAGIGPPAGQGQHHFLHAPHLGEVFVEQLPLEAVALRIPLVHAQQVRPKQRRLVPAGARPDLDDHVLVVVGVLGQEHDLQLLGKGLGLLAQLAQLPVHQLPHFPIQMLCEHFLTVLGSLDRLGIFVEYRYDLLQLGVLLHHVPPGRLVRHGFRPAQGMGELLVTGFDSLQLVQHGSSSCSSKITRSWPQTSFTAVPPPNRACTAGNCPAPSSRASRPPGAKCALYPWAMRR